MQPNSTMSQQQPLDEPTYKKATPCHVHSPTRRDSKSGGVEGPPHKSHAEEHQETSDDKTADHEAAFGD